MVRVTVMVRVKLGLGLELELGLVCSICGTNPFLALKNFNKKLCS